MDSPGCPHRQAPHTRPAPVALGALEPLPCVGPVFHLLSHLQMTPVPRGERRIAPFLFRGAAPAIPGTEQNPWGAPAPLGELRTKEAQLDNGRSEVRAGPSVVAQWIGPRLMTLASRI